MNRSTYRQQEYVSLNHRRFRSIRNIEFQRIVNILMLVATIFRFHFVNGFVSKVSPSIRASIHQRHVCSFAASVKTVRTMAPSGNEAITRRFAFSTSCLQATSKPTSSSVKTSEGNDSYSLSLSIPTMEDMEEVGALLGILSQPTDVLFLDGDLGAGKTTFSRGFIKCKLGIADDFSENEDGGDDATTTARVEDASLRITSPTYLLSNTYEYRDDGDDGAVGDKTREIHHMDLYRLSGKSPRDFDPLDLSHVFSNCISLIEWPSRLQSFPQLLPPDETLLKIDIRIPDPTSDERVMSLASSPESSWTERLQYLIDEGMVDDLLCTEDNEESSSN